MDIVAAWEWDEPTRRGHVERLRAGRGPTPASWPGGTRVAVAIAFDSDHETVALRDEDTSPGLLAAGEYGSRDAYAAVADAVSA